MAINIARIVDPLIEQIENGVVPWRREWASGTGLPRNHIHNKPYTGTNIISCWVHQMVGGYQSNRYVTFDQVRKLSLKFKHPKGDPRNKSCPILFYKKSEKIDKDTGEVESFMTGRLWNCFNIEQIAGIVDPDTSPIYDHDPADVRLAIKIPKALGVEIEGGDPAYVPARDVIKMPDLSRFTSSDAFMTTLAHECVHATGSKSRLGRLTDAKFGSEDYAKEELVAELGAAFIAAEWGISSQLENHASYLNSWLKVLKEEPNFIVTAASAAQKATDYIATKLTSWDIHAETSASLSDLMSYDPEGQYAA